MRHFRKVWGDEADEKIQDAMKEDAAAWGIFAGKKILIYSIILKIDWYGTLHLNIIFLCEFLCLHSIINDSWFCSIISIKR